MVLDRNRQRVSRRRSSLRGMLRRAPLLVHATCGVQRAMRAALKRRAAALDSNGNAQFHPFLWVEGAVADARGRIASDVFRVTNWRNASRWRTARDI